MVMLLKKIVDVAMLVFFILTMVNTHGQIHLTFAWILTALVAIHLLLNWRLILAWLGIRI